MAADYIGFRLPPDERARLEELALGQGLTMSEFLRALVQAALNGHISMSVDEGYTQARATAIQIAHALLRTATESMPQSYEEAIAMLSLNGSPGRGGVG